MIVRIILNYNNFQKEKIYINKRKKILALTHNCFFCNTLTKQHRFVKIVALLHDQLFEIPTCILWIKDTLSSLVIFSGVLTRYQIDPGIPCLETAWQGIQITALFRTVS